MARTAMRRGIAVAFSGVVVAGVVAAGTPAQAADPSAVGAAKGGVSAPPASASASVSSSAADKSARNSGASVGAAHLDGVCNAYSNGDGDLCLWYLSNFVGSHADFFFSDANLNNDRFNSPGAGQGQIVGNNSESAWNYDRHLTAVVYNNPNFTAPSGTIAPNSGGNFIPLFKNNVESFRWI